MRALLTQISGCQQHHPFGRLTFRLTVAGVGGVNELPPAGFGDLRLVDPDPIPVFPPLRLRLPLPGDFLGGAEGP